MSTATSTGPRGSGSAESSVRIRLLGGFDVEVDGQLIPASAWRLRKASELVKVLAITPGHRLQREQAMEQLWPDRPADAALNNLHQALRVARNALSVSGEAGQRILVLRDGVLSLCPNGELWVDAEAFASAVREATVASGLAGRLAARELYRGELLPDDRYADWAEAPREALAQDHLTLLAQLAQLHEREGNREAATETLRELLQHDRADESAHRSLMRLYAVDDQRRMALRQYERLRAAMARELEVEPSHESRQLYREILEGRLGPAAPTIAVRAATSSGVSPDSPPVLLESSRPLAHRMVGRRRDNLPVQLSSFVGREREMREIERLLASSRALTLTGPGGAGKTRLAIEAAASQISAYQDGVWLVELAALSEPALVVQAIADVFDVREQEAVSLVELVIRHVDDRRLLLLLDNCEHLVEACASTAQALLTGCPNLRIIATSRQSLRIPGEVVFRVPSLPVPDPDAVMDPGELAPIDSVRLFVERAQAIVPTFSLTARNAAAVARLCHHLDGLPLAIELAASRVAVLPVTAIADRLDDRFRLLVGGSRTALSRQQTLKATLDWSYNLLTEPQRRVLRALSVFVGGAPLQAVEIVCSGAGLGSSEVLYLLGDLVDQSLVTLDDSDGEPRYRLLETVREYGREQLIERGEREATEAAHGTWALALAEQAEAALPGPEWQASLARLELDHDNLRAALDRSLSADADRALRLAASTWQSWLWHGYLAEGRRSLSRALDGPPTPTVDRARALVGLAALTIRSGETAAGARHADEAFAIFRKLGDPQGACRALQVLGVTNWSEDDLEAAEKTYRLSLEIATDAGFGPGRGAALHGLAVVRWYAGDRREAEALIDESLTLFRALPQTTELTPPMLDLGEILVPQPETGALRMAFQETFAPFQDVASRTAVGYVLANRGMMRRVSGDLEGATRDMEESLALSRAIGDERAVAHALGRLGNLTTAVGELAQARDLLEECLAIRRRIGDSRGTGLAQGNLGTLAIAEGDLARTQALLDDSATAFGRRGDMWGYGSALGNLASLALAKGDIDEAWRLLEESLAAIRITGRARWIAWTLVQLAAVARLVGQSERSASLGADALAIFRRIGDRDGEAACLAPVVPTSAGKYRQGLRR
jgi:predicted ATPase/DNA-binding SARP family transcriptional activator